jgi:hypothetical protein
VSLFVGIIGVVGALVVLGLAGIGAFVLVEVIRSGSGEWDRLERVRRTERQIIDIGRDAQARILADALARLGRPSGTSSPSQDGGTHRRP